MAATKSKTDRMSWFKFDSGAFLSVTAGLSNQHVGIYAKLLASYWTQGNSLNLTGPQLRRRLGLGEEDEKALDEVLSEFFITSDGDNYTHPNLDKQLGEKLAFSETQAERGRLSAVSRTQINQQPSPAITNIEEDDQF